MSFSPIIRVRKLIDKMKADSPRLKRFPSRTSSADLTERPTTDSVDLYPNSIRLTRKNKWTYDPSKPSHFDLLPIENILYILSFLESSDLLNLRGASIAFNKFADDELLWKNLVIYDWNVNNMVCPTWKETYYKLENLNSEGIWEGMSKWIEPSGYDNEQKTTARLWFQKRRDFPLLSENRIYSPKALKRVSSRTLEDNNSSATSSTMETSSTAHKPLTAENSKIQGGYFGILGGGVTVNCASPSPFRIEGERLQSDSTGSTFKWNKQFEKHTSFYDGRIDYETGIVSGTISYNDGTTHWKGIFHYTKVAKHQKPSVNA